MADNPTFRGSPKPAQRLQFPFNKDAARRDSMVGAGLGRDRPGYVGGIVSFDDVDARGLASLIEARFIDPYDRQNAPRGDGAGLRYGVSRTQAVVPVGGGRASR